MATQDTELARVVREELVDDAPHYRRLAELVRKQIAHGALAPGTRLPSERELAEAASVSRTTVVAAYNVLRADALIKTVHRLGTWVAAPPMQLSRSGSPGTANGPGQP
jgi:DNA-binding GntR family transcriptional regulator